MNIVQAPRRRHSIELKTRVLAQCSDPGASIAAVAQAHGLNANLVHKWRRGQRQANPTALRPQAGADTAASFVALQLPPQPTAPDIRIELRRGPTAISLSWPCSAASQCAAWLRELLR